MLVADKSFTDVRSITPTPSDPYGLRSYASSQASASSPALSRLAESSELGIAEVENNDASVVGGRQEGVSARSRKDSGGTRVLSKLFSSWGRSSDKKSASTSAISRQEPSSFVASPSPPTTSQSLPLGFPVPPPLARPADAQPYPPPPRAPFHYVPPPQSRPQPHASACIAPHIAPRVIKTSQSNSTMSTSSSSFASTSAFTDEWDSSSEATSLSMTSSPDSSPRRHGRKSSKSSNGPQRMWRVKGLTEPQIEEKDETEFVTRSRNSTPIPSSFVEAMFAEPATPPRLKRLSASSTKPSPASPPFNLAHEKAARARTRSVQDSPNSPGSCGDADDEDSPRARRKESEGELLGPADVAFSARMRIPSIRFEGISMDEVFAEVEKKMKDEVASGTGSVEKKAKRRTRVFSMYRPMSSFAEGVATGYSSSLSSTTSSHDALSTYSSSTSIASTSSQPLDAPRPRPPNPRRSSVRPSPLNVAAANSIMVREPRPSSVTPTAATAAAARAANSWTPPLAGAFSPTRPTRDIFSPGLDASFSLIPSPGLGEAFVQSPATSSASSMRGVDLPEVCIFPPSPTRRGSEDTISGSQRQTTTRVVVLEPKRTVKTSSRASTVARKFVERRTYVPEQESATPPLSPAFSSLSSGANSPVFLDALPSPTFDRSSDSDVSEAEDALSTLLAKLNAPRTPPTSSLPRVPVPSPVYESDDSATRFGDAPLLISIPRPLHPLVIPTITCSEGPWEDSMEEVQTPRGATPTFVLTPSSSTDSTTSLVTLAGTDSETESEVAVVMMGERISCGYDIGVAM